HPFTWLQVVVGDLYGDLGRLTDRFWGSNFFPRGFPYVLSLYLGATVLAAAIVGAAHGGRRGRILAAAAILALLVCLGRWAGLAPLVDALAVLRRFRYPVKAYFTVHAAAALLVGLAVDRLAAGWRPSWRLFAGAATVLALPLLAAPLLEGLAPQAVRWFMAGFFPPDMEWTLRRQRFAFLTQDAAMGGAVALFAAVLAGAVLAGRLRAGAGAAAAAALMGADLLRAGAGLNPMVAIESLRPSPEVRSLAETWRAGGQRIFVCDPDQSPAYYRARAARGEGHEVWSTWTLLETLTPGFNVPLGVSSAYSSDLTMLVPLPRVLGEAEGCRDLAALTDRLRRAAVAHVISLEPMAAPGLLLEQVLPIPRLAPLAVHVHRLADPLPRHEFRGARVLELEESPGRLEARVQAAGPAEWILREAYAPGWAAKVDGRPFPIALREEWHMAVAVRPGLRHIVLAYRPPG
ncbi:MAG TPA: hypothetical protein VFO85_06895, partial [Vicinamibacteria bacterium]|nr:hypothetical protein [Vicinamibacteria bacterium]